MTELLQCYKSSVNSWECDENNHLNVRFFMEKSMQTLRLGLIGLGIFTRGQQAKIEQTIRFQHMRFVAEARMATPISGYIGIIKKGVQLEVLTELRHTCDQNVLCAIIHTLALPTPAVKLAVINQPDHAGSKGIPVAALPDTTLSLDRALQAGFFSTGRGLVQPHESAYGKLVWYQYMGCISDSIPNLWSAFKLPSNNNINEDIGRAVLEYRSEYFVALQLGDRFEVLSGLRQLGVKTQRVDHLVFNLETGQCAFASAAISIGMNLKTRKAITTPTEQQMHLRKFLLPSQHEYGS